MALNKRKILDSARKFAQKGAKAKALKEYQLLLQADPRDAKLLLEVGDAYRRWGQSDDAIAQYGKVAQQYRQDGFDARAVAVYKQILNLDPKHYAAYVSLSELYQRMGLDSEAIGALQTAADGYHREGRKTDALELLRQMAALDPTNTTSRLKVAELLRQEKMPAEALAEYEAAARELENQQDRDQLVAVRERILELKPDHLGALTGMVRTLMVSGKLDRAEPFALRALQVSGEPAQYELVIELFAQMGNDSKLAEATRCLAKLYRDRGDEDKARELMQRLPADEVGARSRLAVDVSEVSEPQIEDDELLEDDPFVTVSGLRTSARKEFVADELELGEDDEIQLETPKSAARPASAPLEGDPDQLLAEASVYLRYGKRGQAIQSLRTVLDLDPNHRGALEKLGEAYADDGQAAEAVATWLRAAEQIRKSGDAKALAVLRDRIATLDPKAAAQLVPTASPAPLPEVELDLDLDLDLEVDLDEAFAEGTASAHLATVDVDDDAELGFEVDLDEAAESFRVDADATGEVAAEEKTSSISLADDGTFEFEIDPDEISGDGAGSEDRLSASAVAGQRDLDSSAADGVGATTAAPGTTTSTARIREELGEAEFYIAQEMFDEAESILMRILEIAPNHPSAMLRMGEVQVARGSAPESAPAVGDLRTKTGRRVAGTSEHDLGSTARFEEGLDLDSPDASGDLDLASVADDPDASSNGTSGFELDVDVTFDAADVSADDADLEVDVDVDVDVEGTGGVDVEIDVASETSDDETGLADSESALSFDAQDEETDSVVSAPTVAIQVPPTPPVPARPAAKPAPTVKITPPPAPRPAPAVEPVVAPTVRSAPTPPPIAAAAEFSAGDVFDLREALADVFNEPGESARGKSASVVLSTVADGFESIFSDFKKGVSETLDKGDVDTRYDLGIAYREMGLFEDAIGEFKICLEAPSRRFDSLYLMGLCARDLQRFGDAVHHLEQALALPDLPGDRTAGVFFDLSIAQSLAGDRDRARANMRRVLELDPSFPNAGQKLAELESAASVASPVAAEAGGARSGFESFDDLFSDDEAGLEPAVVESFESFDDVVSDVEATPIEAPPATRPPPAATEPTSPSDSNTQSGRKSARKKISFV